ncbi:unnamed protein product [Heligmosomoides polygyrus]|uniref:RGS domain-containing protein n=1 Tax=Heligmosomoides polygyrus TaxID=6339 RepID=A0A183FLA7_HELPZ|nr:unnamed protein product [Heligmosomoides polygyrus]
MVPVARVEAAHHHHDLIADTLPCQAAQPRITVDRVLFSPNEWQFAFDHVISDADGRAQFTKFLQSEYSEENILFWWAVEELKTVCSSECRSEFERTVLEMFETFIASESPLAINIDHDTRTDIIDRFVFIRNYNIIIFFTVESV